MDSRKISALLGLAASLCISTAFAQAPPEAVAPLDPTGSWLFTIGVEQVSLDEKQSAVEWIDDSAVGINFEGEYFFHPHYSVSLGISLLSYDDNASFTQETEDSWGDDDSSESDAMGFPLYGEVGYKHFFGPHGKTYVAARGGYSVMLASERGIGNCSNCYEEDIDIEGGAYGSLGAGVRLGTSWLLGVQYKHYFSGDIDRSAGLSISYSYF